MDPTNELEVAHLKSLVDSLVPIVVNAPGNHDLINEKVHSVIPHSDWTILSHKKNRFIVLNSEEVLENKPLEQLTSFTDSVQTHGERPGDPEPLYLFSPTALDKL